jgi:hypothetical protein
MRGPLVAGLAAAVFGAVGDAASCKAPLLIDDFSKSSSNSLGSFTSGTSPDFLMINHN